MKRLRRAARALLVLVFSLLLVRAVHYGFSMFWTGQTPQLPPEQSENVQPDNIQSENVQPENVQPEKPSPQEIVRNFISRIMHSSQLIIPQAASMNTFWEEWDE
jgi:hypothetical protein